MECNPHHDHVRAHAQTPDWLCDYCNQAAFRSYEEAVQHEAVCSKRPRSNSSSNNTSSGVVVPATHNAHYQLQQLDHSNHGDIVTVDAGVGADHPADTVTVITTSGVVTDDSSSKKQDQSSSSSRMIVTHHTQRQSAIVSNNNTATANTATTSAYLHNRRYLLGITDDRHWLSDLLCLIRENLEVFSATTKDIAERSKKGGMKTPIQPGRMGLRCIHCAHLPSSYRAKGAVSYPHSIRIVHQSVRNWQRYHFDACHEIPSKVRQRYAALRSVRAHSGNASLQYWIDSAKSLGMVDTDHGIFFQNEPVSFQDLLAMQCSKNLDDLGSSEAEASGSGSGGGSDAVALYPQQQQKQELVVHERKKNAIPVSSSSSKEQSQKQQQQLEKSAIEKDIVMHSVVSSNLVLAAEEETTIMSSTSTPRVAPTAHDNDHDLVVEDDRHEIPDFLYLLMTQQKRCTYNDQDDRNGKRKLREVGFPGVECRHCIENAGAGRYFPQSVALLANSNNPFNCTHSHVIKCRKCPKAIKDALAEAHKSYAEQSSKLKPDWKVRFFDKVWRRIHGDEASTSAVCDDIDVRGDEENKVEAMNEEDVAALALSSLANCSAIKRSGESGEVVCNPSSFSQMRSNKLPMKKRKHLE